MQREAELFRCDSCVWGKHCDESRPAPIAKWVIKGVIESRTCLLPMVTAQSVYLLRMFGHYKQGILAQPGGILDQPNYYIEVMEILSAREGEVRAEFEEKRRREQSAAHRQLGP